jgi:hypothetical protein
MADKWIQGAIKRPGAFRAKAEKAGMSTQEYARKVSNDPKASTRTKRQAALARTLGRMNKRKHHRKSSR